MPRARTQTGSVLPGWQAPCYQATSGPIIMGGVPQMLFFGLIGASALGGMLYPRILWVTGSIYLASVIGTMWEPNWYPMLKEYLGYGSVYEA